MKLFCLKIKNFRIFSQKKVFLIFWKMEAPEKNFLYFRNEFSELEKMKKIYLEKVSYISGVEFSSSKTKLLFS